MIKMPSHAKVIYKNPLRSNFRSYFGSRFFMLGQMQTVALAASSLASAFGAFASRRNNGIS